MKQRPATSPKERLTLFDLLGLALLNAAVALPTGCLLWLVLNGFPFGWIGWLPGQSVLWFTAAAAALGVLTRENWLADFYGWSWRAILRWFSYGA